MIQIEQVGGEEEDEICSDLIDWIRRRKKKQAIFATSLSINKKLVNIIFQV